MKKWVIIALVTALVSLARAETQGPAGKWRGVITERGRSTQVGLDLEVTAETVGGKLTVLTETGQDVGKGMSFPIVQGERSGNSLKFFVAIVNGKVDSDALFFELIYKDEVLDGTAHENRPNSTVIPVRFNRPIEP